MPRHWNFIATLFLAFLIGSGMTDNTGEAPTSHALASDEGSESESLKNTRHMFLLPEPNLDATNEFLGIPGTTQTVNGYDTALGVNPICWMGQAAPWNSSKTQMEVSAFPNPLVENFTLLGKTELLTSCPEENFIRVEQPVEATMGERLRTLQFYNYTVELSLNVKHLQGDFLVSDEKGPTIGLQVVLCTLGKSGFCSPFVHEQANARDEYLGIDGSNREEGDLHGGTHIHSPWVFLDMGDDTQLVKVNVTVPMIVNVPDDYYVIGTAQFYTNKPGTNKAAFRYDMANALLTENGRILAYQDPPTILMVSDATRIFGLVCSVLAASIISFYIFQTILWRNEKVMQLSQANYLLAFLVAALIASSSVVLLEPKNNLYCRIYSPMIILPIHIMYAVTVGRLWRIHSVISPLVFQHLHGDLSWTHHFVEMLTKISLLLPMTRNPAHAWKRQVATMQLLSIVIMLTLPQVFVQALILLFQPLELQIDFNSDESIGRVHCLSTRGFALLEFSLVLLLVLVVVLLLMAHSASKLPSLLNESQIIYDSTFLSIMLMLMGVAIIAVTTTPTTSPDVEFLVWLILILSITLNSTGRLMNPKLRKVWSREQIVVSKLVSDHNIRMEEERLSSSRVGGSGGSGDDIYLEEGSWNDGLPKPHESGYVASESNPSISFLKESEVLQRLKTVDEMHKVDSYDDVGKRDDSQGEHVILEGSFHPAVDHQVPTDLEVCQEQAGLDPSEQMERAEGRSSRQARMLSSSMLAASNRSLRKKRDKIHVCMDEAPSKRLILKMMHLQEKLTGINTKVMSGEVVTPDDWANVTFMTSNLEAMFSDEVDFEFELPPLADTSTSGRHK